MRRIYRRQFLIATTALFAARLAHGQQATKLRRIGFLGINDPKHPGAQLFRKGITNSLSRLSYKEGGNLVIEWRYAEGKLERLPALADELVRLKVELIMTPQNTSTIAARRATKTIPIVMISSSQPVESGFIESYAHPGGNITGLDWWPTPELSEKTYQILKLAVPGAKIVASIRASKDPTLRLYGDDFARRVASNVGLSIVHAEMAQSGDLPSVLAKISTVRADVLYVGSGDLSRHFPEIVAFATKQKLVSISGSASYQAAGGLLTYGPDLSAAWDRAASYVDRILRGAKPADLPVELPTKYELVLNTKTAKAMGLTLPPSLMLRVDRVIE